MNLNSTKFKVFTEKDDTLQLRGKLGFVYVDGDHLAASLEAPRIGALVKKFLKTVPGSTLKVLGDWEAVCLFPNSQLFNAHKVMKLQKKKTVKKRIKLAA